MRGRLNLATQLKTATQQGLLSVVLFIRTSLLVYFPILDVLLFRTPADRGHFGSSLRAANSEQTAFSKERITVLHGMQQMTPQQLSTVHKGPGQNLAILVQATLCSSFCSIISQIFCSEFSNGWSYCSVCDRRHDADALEARAQ